MQVLQLGNIAIITIYSAFKRTSYKFCSENSPLKVKLVMDVILLFDKFLTRNIQITSSLLFINIVSDKLLIIRLYFKYKVCKISSYVFLSNYIANIAVI